MEIPPITINFQTKSAVSALEDLAAAALENPEIVKGIAKLESPLFEAGAEIGRDFTRAERNQVTVTVFPSERLCQFLRGLGKTPRMFTTPETEPPAILRPR